MKLSAQHVLKGFMYQFHRSISEILQLRNSSDTAIFEAIEDLEVAGRDSNNREYQRAIQFKYLPSRIFSASTIREAVMGCLDCDFHDLRDWEDEGKKRRYELFVHCDVRGTYKLETVEDLKALARYSDHGKQRDFIRENKIPDFVLEDFMKRFCLTLGMSYEDSLTNVIALLRDEFGCTAAEAEDYHYPRAIESCLFYSTQMTVGERTVSRGDFAKRVRGLGYRALGLGYRGSGFGYRVSGNGGIATGEKMVRDFVRVRMKFEG